jgi:hypothetical protein
VPREELPAVFDRLAEWLRPEGILYASFYAGEGREQETRFFNDIGRTEGAELATGTDGLASQEVWTTDDSSGRDEVRWINVLAERKAQ